MAYEKQNFKSGEKLYASQLNAMDDQIAKNAQDVESLNEEIAAQNESLKQLADEVSDMNGTAEVVSVPISNGDILDGFFIMEGIGAQVQSSNWTCTDWIPVSFDGGRNVSAKCVLYGSGAFVFYDAQKTPLLSVSGNNCSDYGITASAEPQAVTLPCPDHTAYIRMCMLKSAYNTDGKGYELSGYVTNSLANMIAAANRNIADVDRRLNLNVTNFYNKKVLVFGDSISADYYGEYPKWVTHLIEERFFDVEKTANDSTHATGFVARYNGQPNDFITRMEAISAADTYDIVIVFGGINDYIQAIPMGESGGDKLTHFKPAVDYFFATLAERFVNARLLVLLPLRTNGYGNENREGCTQADYAEYIRTVAMQYALPVLNLMDDSGFNPKLPVFKNRWTLTEYEGGDGVTGDGVHPNEEYERRFLAPMIRAFLQSVM